MIVTTKRGWIFLAALLGALGAGPEPAAGIEVSVAVAEDRSADAPFEVIVVAEPADAGTAGAAEAAMEYRVEPGRWTLDLPEGRRWLLWAEAPGYWSNEVQVERGTAGQLVELWLWRAGILRGGLSTTADEELPGEVELRLEGDALASDAGGPQSTIIKCPVVQEVWQCEVPAGRLDLILAADGFASHHRPRVIVKPDQVRDLGTFKLELGGSIVGWIELEDGGVPSSECQVRLENSASGRSDRGSLPRAGVKRDGRFEFQGIPARQYVLTASLPGYLPVTGTVIEVLPGETVEVPEPLVLRMKAALEVVFSPPTGPKGRSWQFELKELDPGGGRRGKVLRGKAEPNGTWVKEDLVPGPYEISLSGEFESDPVRRRFELPSGWSSILIESSLVQIEGQVLIGGEPVAAKVTLSRPEEKLSATFESDETGFFSGLLPREGRWQVRVDVPAEAMSMELDPVEVWNQGGSGVAVVEIRLPGTVLEVEVTDRLGSPIPEAMVSVRHGGPFAEPRSFTTDSAGWFRIRGLEPGSISVMAVAGQLRSQWIDLILYDDRPGPALRIVVR